MCFHTLPVNRKFSTMQDYSDISGLLIYDSVVDTPDLPTTSYEDIIGALLGQVTFSFIKFFHSSCGRLKSKVFAVILLHAWF